jgi:hypothetical protein
MISVETILKFSEDCFSYATGSSATMGSSVISSSLGSSTTSSSTVSTAATGSEISSTWGGAGWLAANNSSVSWPSLTAFWY